MKPAVLPAPGTLFVVAAPSGGGKTSLVKALLECTSSIEVSVSHTTRAPRPGERDGVDYHFVAPEEFLALIERGIFLEHAQVFTHYYGTSRDAVMARLTSGVDVVLEIDWQGARQVRSQLADSVGIFILPPSRAVLYRRLKQRGQDQAAVIEQRSRAAAEEMRHYDEFDYLIVNDRFASSLEALRAIVIAQRQRRDRQARLHAERLRRLLS